MTAGSTNVSPKPATGLYFVCTVAGTSGGVQPVWPSQPGQTIGDNGITWTAQPDPGAQITYAQPTAYGTVVLGFTLGFVGIVDTRWQ